MKKNCNNNLKLDFGDWIVNFQDKEDEVNLY